MGWFSKEEKKPMKKEVKDSKVSELPELPELPSSNSKISSFKESSLPSFPSSPAGDKMSQVAVKHAVGESSRTQELPESSEDLPEFQPDKAVPLSEPPKSELDDKLPKEALKSVEFKGKAQDIVSKMEPRVPELGTRTSNEVPEFAPRKPLPSSNKEPIFVRIDKYQSALAKFQEIKKQVLEIENMLKDIKEFKKREEAELFQWEQEVQSAKTKLEQVDRTLFQKLD